MARIFVSYRRQDSAGHAGRIYDRLQAFFGSGRVFMDVEGIAPGADFAQVLDERVADAEVVVAVIGPGWVSATGADGERRILADGDFVRAELATAFARDVEVIPVLVAGAQVPRSEELPEDLAELERRNMYVISEGSFDADLARLIQAVERSAARSREKRRLAPQPKSDFSKRWWPRLLLLYEPAHPATWLLHILFFLFLLLWACSPLAALAPDSVGLSFALIGLYMLAFPVLLIRTVVFLLEPDAVVSPLRRWLLLFNPPRVTVGAIHLLFLFMAFGCYVSLPSLLQRFWAQGNDVQRTILVLGWLALVVLTLVVREIGASKDPLNPALREPSWFARLLCIWRPRRSAAWLPRIIYYAAALMLTASLPLTLADAEGNFTSASLARRGDVVLLALLAAIAVSARGFARAIEVSWLGGRASGLARGLQSMLLLDAPWRRAGWAASALFWLGLVLLVAVGIDTAGVSRLLGWDQGTGARPAFLLLVAFLLVVCSRGWAQLYRCPEHWNRVEAPLGSHSTQA